MTGAGPLVVGGKAGTSPGQVRPDGAGDAVVCVDGGDGPALADVIAAAAGSCPGVVRLSGAVRSYLPGRTVPGVVIGPDHVQVNVVTRYGPTVAEIVAGLTAGLASVLDGRALWVSVDDITLPGEPEQPAITADETSRGGPDDSER